jgi:hypothetical protein
MTPRVFIGFDTRQPLGYNVLQHSLHRYSAHRVIVEPLILSKLPIHRRGLTDFTYSRFIVPYLCGYDGAAVFMDADVVVTGDIGELIEQADATSAVQVMQEQPRFEWPSVMLFNCTRCKVLTPEYIDDPANSLMKLDWGPVGTFSREWNHCVNKMDPAEAKLYHYTEGLPCWEEVIGSPLDKVWLDEFADMQRTVGWRELMGQSVHMPAVLTRMVARKFGVQLDVRAQ